MSEPTNLPIATFTSPAAPLEPTTAATHANWSGNYNYHAQELLYPSSIAEVQQLVTGNSRIKALGSRHSFNGIADTMGVHLSLRSLNTMTLDREAARVTVGAGVTYGQLAPWLDAQGFAVHNLASLPHITVVGAVATGTHGSGVGNGSLATAVSALSFVDGTGQLVQLSRDADPEVFPGAVVALGSLGIVTDITLSVQPSFQVAQTVYEALSFEKLEHGLEEIFASAYSVSLFTDWQQHRVTQAWLKRRVAQGHAPQPALHFHGATLQTQKLHPLAGHPAENCTEQQGISGPWYERLPHFRMDFTPSSGAELQTEYFIAREHAFAAIQALEELRDIITPNLIVSELRAVAADDLWLSMAYQRHSLAIHFTWLLRFDVIQQVLPRIEEKLAPFQARPHWAKLFTMPGTEVQSLYAKLPEFLALTQRFDPLGRFRNDFTDSAHL